MKISISKFKNEDYICITDFTSGKVGNSRSSDIIKNWLRTRYILEFLGTWEKIYNPDFKVVEFDHFKNQAGLASFTLSISEWVNKTNAIGVYVKRGKYGGTYAHKDIAFEFASAISPVFKLYLIKEFQRLKLEEDNNQEWNAKRFLSKNNYLIHTDAIKNHIIPNSTVFVDKEWIIYAEEADILNAALFKCLASEWRKANPELSSRGNMRDYASINELTVLSNLETHNAELIKENKTKEERFEILLSIASNQLDILNRADNLKVEKESLELSK